jgi:hypothetical protein
LTLISPLFLMIWSDISSDYDRENYVKHQPLYEELEREKRSEPPPIRP